MTRRPRGARLAVALLAALTAAPLAAGTTAAAPRYPQGERINPARLSTGPATPLLRVVGRTIVDGSTRIKVPGNHVWMVGRSAPDYLVMTSDADFENWRLLRVTPAGTTSRIIGGPNAVPEHELADGGAHVALQTYARRNTVFRVVDTTSGDVVRRREFNNNVGARDFGKRRLVLSEWESRTGQERTFWWNPFSNRTARIIGKTAYMVDVAADRLAFFTKDPYQGGCQKVATLSRPRTLLWRSCTDRVISFSPNGKRMVSTYILSDGPGPDLVQVRGARGKVYDTYRAAWFGFLKWETDRRLLLNVAGTRTVTVARCTLKSCERVSKLHRTRGEDPWVVMPTWTFAPESLLDR